MSIQIFEDEPSFATQFAKSSLGAGANFAKTFIEEKGKKKAMEAENESMKKYGIDLSGIRDPELRKIFATQMLKNQGTQAAGQAKAVQKQQEAQQAEQGTREALDWLEDNIKYAGAQVPFTSSFTMGKLNREAVQKREDFNSTGFWVADKIYTHFNKGQITDKKLKMIQEKLAPNASLSERQNKARIAAMRRIANLPRNAPTEVVDKSIEKELKALKKIEAKKSHVEKPQEKPPLESFYR